MKIWDVSRTLSNDLAEWPGDEPCRFRLTREKTKGESVNLGAISMSVHNGTHADAQFHFDTNGGSIEKASLETYLGRATVVDLAQAFLESKEKRLITIEDLRPAAESIAATSRLPDPRDRSRCAGVAAEKWRQIAGVGSALRRRNRFEIVAEPSRASARRSRDR